MELRLIYITAANADQAARIGEALVEERLVACVNMLAPMTSIFRWDGAVQREAEIPIVAKTRAELVDRVVERVRSLHSYAVPCVVSMPIDGGNPDYLKWLAAETAVPRAAGETAVG